MSQLRKVEKFTHLLKEIAIASSVEQTIEWLQISAAQHRLSLQAGQVDSPHEHITVFATRGKQVATVVACREVSYAVGMREQGHAVKWVARERKPLQANFILCDVGHVAVAGDVRVTARRYEKHLFDETTESGSEKRFAAHLCYGVVELVFPLIIDGEKK